MDCIQYWRIADDPHVHPLLRGQYVFKDSQDVLNVDFAWTSYEVRGLKLPLQPLSPEVAARANLMLNWNNDLEESLPAADRDADKIRLLFEMGEVISERVLQLRATTKKWRGANSLRFNDLVHAEQAAKIGRVLAAPPDNHAVIHEVYDLWEQAKRFQRLAVQIAEQAV